MPNTKDLVRPPAASFEVERESRYQTRKLLREVEHAITTRRHGIKELNGNGKSDRTSPDRPHRDRNPSSLPKARSDSLSERDAEVLQLREKFDCFLDVTGLRRWLAECIEDAARDDKFESSMSCRDFFRAYFLEPKKVSQACEFKRTELCALLAERARQRDQNAELKCRRQVALLSRNEDTTEDGPTIPDRKNSSDHEHQIQGKKLMFEQTIMIPDGLTQSAASETAFPVGFAMDSDDAVDYQWAEAEYGYDEYTTFYDDLAYDYELSYDAETEEAKRKAQAALAAQQMTVSRDTRTLVEDVNMLTVQSAGQNLGAAVSKTSAVDLKSARKDHSAEKDSRTPVSSTKSAARNKPIKSPDRSRPPL